VHGKLGWDGVVDAGQKAAELDGAVPAGQIGDHLARGHIQGGVQVGGAMAGVVMGGPLGVPGSSGSTGAVRSSACTWVFSSTHRTRAAWGGLRYSPTMSRTLSMNCGSVESLNASVRCGLSPNARQIRHDPAALGQRLAGGPPPGPALQGGALLVS
jgi:hypothetical protein